MINAKAVQTLLAAHFKLSNSQSLESDKDKNDMTRIPYAQAVGCLMYAMVCTRPDIAFVVSVVSRFMANP